ncbi:MAG: ATP-binding cassette domain-containing protein [Alphaproteobacteria bacterium]|nr:ATP-binding cassette domain-containing protein [Alphaproteobacteria bacterium]
MNQPVITAQNLHKTYGKGEKAFEAVKGVNFAVQQGTCTGLLGPNGAGKSTTMRMLMGLSTITEGKLTVLNAPADKLPRNIKARIGLVPQEDNLDPDLTVSQNLSIYGRYFGIDNKTIKERVPQLLAFMKLEEKADARVNQLSGGMKRRLIIARALINDPDLIILDEPTTGLDPQARVMIWQRILELKNQGKTLLLTTHYMDEAQRLCDDIIVIDHGKVLDNGTPQELISRHVKAHAFDITKPVPKALEKLPEGATQEDLGDSILFHMDDAAAFRKLIPQDATYLHRPANLEDVFLNLTGRSLRE